MPVLILPVENFVVVQSAFALCGLEGLLNRMRQSNPPVC